MPPRSTESNSYRIPFLIMDVLLVNIALFLSMWLRLGGTISPVWADFFRLASLCLTPLIVIAALMFGIYNRLREYVRWQDALALFSAITSAWVVASAIIIAIQPDLFSRTVLAMTWPVALLLIFASRGVWLLVRGRLSGNGKAANRIPVIVYGAGQIGSIFVRHVASADDAPWRIIGFVDDDFSLTGMIVGGYRVLGRGADLAELADTLKAEQIIITAPSASSTRLGRMIHHAQSSGVVTQVLRSFVEVPAGGGSSDAPGEGHQKAAGEEEAAVPDLGLTAENIDGRTVLLIAADGTIGARICHRLGRCAPKRIIVGGSDESRVNPLCRELEAQYPDIELIPCICATAYGGDVRSVVGQHQPEVIIHSSTHGHPYMPENASLNAANSDTDWAGVVVLTDPEIGAGGAAPGAAELVM